MKPGLEQRLSDALSELHQEALEAIREVRPTLFAQVAETYERVLLTLPETWARYGASFSRTLAEGIDWTSQTPLGTVARALYVETETAIRGRSSEIAHDVLSLPYGVALRSISLNAFALASEMLQLLTSSYLLTLEAPDRNVGRRSAEWIARVVGEFSQYGVGARLEGKRSTIGEQESAFEFMQIGFRSIAVLLKLMLDSDDPEGFVSLDDRWSLVLEHWTPEFERPHETEVELLLAQFGEQDARVKEARAKLERNTKLADMKTKLLKTRLAFRFMLLAWARHTLRRGERPSVELQRILESLMAHFEDPVQSANAADAALQDEWGDRSSLWRDWSLQQLPEGRVHSIDPSGDLLATFCLTLLARVDPDAAEAEVPAHEWMLSRRDALKQALSEAGDDWQKLRRADDQQLLEGRLSIAKSILDKAAARQKALEEDSVRQARISPALVESFKDTLHRSWMDRRLASRLFQWQGAYERGVATPAEGGWRGYDRLIPKEMFIEGARVFGMDMAAADVGRALADAEMSVLLEYLQSAPDVGPNENDVPQTIAAALRDLEEGKFHPSLLLTSVDWRLQGTLGLRDPFAEVIPPEGLSLSEESRHWFRGQIEELAVFQWPSVPDNESYVVDLASFARWRDFPASPQEIDVLVEVSSYDRESALKAAQENEDLLRSEERQTPESRALELQRFVLLHVRSRFLVEVRNLAWIHRRSVCDVSS